MPTIRFENDTDARVAKHREKFLESLDLDPALWGEEQEFKIPGSGLVSIFNMDVELPDNITKNPNWVCRVEKVEISGWDVEKFLIGGRVLCAKVGFRSLSGTGMQDQARFEKSLGILPDYISALSIDFCFGDLSLSSIAGRFKNLSGLSLDNFVSADVSMLACLNELKYLSLSFGKLVQLPALTNLNRFIIVSCNKIQSIGSLAQSQSLTMLIVIKCPGLLDFTFLQQIKHLASLTIRESKIKDVSFISELTSLKHLDLRRCFNIQTGLDLKNLKGLNHFYLGEYPRQGSAKLSEGFLINLIINLEFLRHNTDLEVLSLRCCSCLETLLGIDELLKIKYIDVSVCQNLTGIGCLKKLPNLQVLNIENCEKIRQLPEFNPTSKLSRIDVTNCLRIGSIESVRVVPSLHEVKGFHPDQTAELLAHTAVLRKDDAYIDDHASAWLQQIQQMDEAAPEERERFATTLGEALSLLGESPHEETYETYLAGRPEFSASPWKAWFSGTREVSSWELMRVRAERQELTNANPGCIGGVCASLSGGDEVSKDERQWALDWLGRMEQAWAERGKELLPVAAEVCVAHLRHGLDDALGRWLLRLTDESDPASMDLVHVALGEWQLERGNPDAARNHAGAIETPERRDSLLAELAKHYVADEPQTAGGLLLTISSPPMRREIMELLCENTSFVADPLNVERLVVACGDSAEALSGLIAKLPPETDSSLLDQLSTAVREGSRNFHSLHRSTLQRMLEDLLKEFRDDKNAEE